MKQNTVEQERRDRAGGVVNATVWQEIRRIVDGESHALAREYVQRHYPRAWARGAVRSLYLPILPYACRMAAGAMDLPFRVKGPDAFRALVKRWRPILSRAWQVRFAGGSSFVHVQRHRDRLILGHLWSDGIEVLADPAAPTEWDLLREVRIKVQGERWYVYRQTEDGGVETLDGWAAGSDMAPIQGPATEWGVVPVFPAYRDAPDRLQPEGDRTVLDAHVAAGLQLSDIEYRRVYRAGVLWRKTDAAGPNVIGPGGGEVETGYDTVQELGDQDAMGLVESSLKPAEDLDYIAGYLRLVAKTMGLPPELFVTGSRAETGAAKSWDYAPLLDLQQADRAAADEWLAELVTYTRPILEAEGVLGPGDEAEIRTVAPKRPAPDNPAAYYQGLELGCRLGATSVVKDISERMGVSLQEAERLAGINRKQNAALGIGTVDDRGGGQAPLPAGNTQAVTR